MHNLALVGTLVDLGLHWGNLLGALDSCRPDILRGGSLGGQRRTHHAEHEEVCDVLCAHLRDSTFHVTSLLGEALAETVHLLGDAQVQPFLVRFRPIRPRLLERAAVGLHAEHAAGVLVLTDVSPVEGAVRRAVELGVALGVAAVGADVLALHHELWDDGFDHLDDGAPHLLGADHHGLLRVRERPVEDPHGDGDAEVLVPLHPLVRHEHEQGVLVRGVVLGQVPGRVEVRDLQQIPPSTTDQLLDAQEARQVLTDLGEGAQLEGVRRLLASLRVAEGDLEVPRGLAGFPVRILDEHDVRAGATMLHRSERRRGELAGGGNAADDGEAVEHLPVRVFPGLGLRCSIRHHGLDLVTGPLPVLHDPDDAVEESCGVRLGLLFGVAVLGHVPQVAVDGREPVGQGEHLVLWVLQRELVGSSAEGEDVVREDALGQVAGETLLDGDVRISPGRSELLPTAELLFPGVIGPGHVFFAQLGVQAHPVGHHDLEVVGLRVAPLFRFRQAVQHGIEDEVAQLHGLGDGSFDVGADLAVLRIPVDLVVDRLLEEGEQGHPWVDGLVLAVLEGNGCAPPVVVVDDLDHALEALGRGAPGLDHVVVVGTSHGRTIPVFAKIEQSELLAGEAIGHVGDPGHAVSVRAVEHSVLPLVLGEGDDLDGLQGAKRLLATPLALLRRGFVGRQHAGIHHLLGFPGRRVVGHGRALADLAVQVDAHDDATKASVRLAGEHGDLAVVGDVVRAEPSLEPVRADRVGVGPAMQVAGLDGESSDGHGASGQSGDGAHGVSPGS